MSMSISISTGNSGGQLIAAGLKSRGQDPYHSLTVLPDDGMTCHVVVNTDHRPRRCRPAAIQKAEVNTSLIHLVRHRRGHHINTSGSRFQVTQVNQVTSGAKPVIQQHGVPTKGIDQAQAESRWGQQYAHTPECEQ